MKKLIPALALLLISAVMLGTSSFAWFSMNTEVTATGMSVTAQAPTSLLISNTSATAGFGSSVALANDVTTPDSAFVPVAYAGACTGFYKLTSAAMAKVNENGRVVAADFSEVADGSAALSFTNAEISSGVAAYADGGKSVYHDTVWLKVEGEKNQVVTATVAYTGTPSEVIKGAMHVVFVIGGAVAAECDMGGNPVTTSTLATLTANDEDGGTQVDIYYFLSGNDTDCKNVNITQNTTLSIDITFHAADPS